jgi:DNA-binding transcriptional MerR regulator
MSGLLTIGKFARIAGVSVDTIRYYERLGLLPKVARTAAGYRQYSEGVATRLALVRNAQRFGFSLREIAGFMRVREAGGKPCRDVRVAAQRMLQAVDQQIDDLKATRQRMVETLREWDHKLAGTPDDTPARLLETLNASGTPNKTARARRFSSR